MQFTFDGIKSEFKSRLSLLSNWRKTLYFGVYERLADVVAYVLDKFVYITEVYYRESNWLTATLRTTLVTRSKFLSYTPYRKVSASGNIVLSADPSFSSVYTYSGESVVIPRWTEFIDTTTTITVFNTEQIIYYKNTVGSLTIPVKEGIPKSFTYTAKGEISETIYLYSDSIENDEIEIFIVDTDGNVLYDVSIVEDLYFIEEQTNYYCTVKNASDFTNVQIQFGDNITARSLTVGEKVLIKYAESKGDEGNIQSTGVIVTVKNQLYDADENPVTLYVTNLEAIADGRDHEEIESIRQNAPRLFQTGYRAGSEDDWVAIIETHPQVYKAIVWTEEDLGNPSLGYDQNKVYGTAISADGTELTSAQKSDISLNYIKERKSPTEIFIWEPLEIIFSMFKVWAKVQTLSFPVITGQVKDTLHDTYGILNVDFKQNIYESNFINTIDDLETVIHHETELYHLEKNFAATLSQYEVKVSYPSSETAVLEEQVYLSPDTMEIWIKRKISDTWYDPFQCAYESSGQLWGTSGFVFSSTDVDYANNEITYTCDTIVNNPGKYGIQNPGDSNPTGYILSIAYKTQDGYGEQTNNLRISKFYQITDVDEDYIFCDLEY